MLTALLIMFVVALALAPLLHFLPSKRQRKVARLREYAALHGLFVEFRNVPGSDRTARPVAAPRGEIIYYGKRFPPSRGAPVTTAAWVTGPDRWRSVGSRQPAPAQLQGMVPGILAASVDQSSCGVYWVESGEEGDVESIRQALEAWSAALLS